MYSTVSNIKESLKLAWKHKLLWILALLVGGGMSFGSGFGGGDKSESIPSTSQPSFNEFNFDENILQDTLGTFDIKTNETPSDEGNVMKVKINGDEVTIEGTPTSETITPQVFPSPPPHEIIRILTSVLWLVPILMLAILFGIAVKVAISGWASGGYYSGQLKAVSAQPYDFKDLGSEGKRIWWRFIKLGIFYGLVHVGILIPGLLFISLGAAIESIRVLTIVLGVLLVIVGIIFNILLTFAEEFSKRIIVEQEISTKEAFKLGFKYYKTRPGKSIKLALLLPLFFILVVIVIGIVGGMYTAIVVMLTKQGGVLLIPAYLLTFVGLLTLLAGFIVGMPFSATLTAFTWTKLYLFTKESFVVSQVVIQPSVPNTQTPDSTILETEVQNGQQ